MMATTATGRAQTVVRRIIVFVLLLTLVVIAAIGLAGLIEQIIGAGATLAGDDAGLARSLAFAVIGAPLAGVLWWWERRRLVSDVSERASLVWTLYLTVATLTALVTSASALAITVNAALDGRWQPADAAAAIVWAGIWVWHRHMRRSSATAPTRLPLLPVQLSALYGLAVAASGAISAIAALVSEALAGVAPVLADSRTWFVPVLQALVWLAVGAVVWWWHRFREGARDERGGFATVVLVVIIGASAATALFGLGTVLFVVLRLLFDADAAAEVLSPLGPAIGAALVGAIVWDYHRQVMAARSERARRAARLVTSGVALIGAASGFGVVINALLATLGPTLVDSNPRTLLLGGLSALVVGAPVWWIAWRPDRAVSETDAGDPARRVYLIVVFGASAIVALVALLVIAYRVLEVLIVGGAGGLIEHIRAPFGLLCATAVVFAYHLVIWRRDRRVAPTATTPERPALARVVLVAGGDTDLLATRLRTELGVPVTVWRTTGDGGALGDDAIPGLLESLRGVPARRALVIAEAAGARVIPLEE